MPQRLFLVDDHQIVIEGLRLLLEGQEGLQIVGTAFNCDVAWTLIGELRPDIVLMDLEMPGEGGLALTARITKALPATKVIVLTGRADAAIIHAALTAGARGFVLKLDVSSEIVAAIRAAVAGEIFVSPQVATLIADDVRRQFQTTASLKTLTARECDIVRRIAEGQSTKEIAFELQLSAKTIETHRANIMEKVGVKSVAALTKYAVREGLTQL